MSIETFWKTYRAELKNLWRERREFIREYDFNFRDFVYEMFVEIA